MASVGRKTVALDCGMKAMSFTAQALKAAQRVAKIMASVVTLLTVDIVGMLAALSIWTVSFLLLLRSWTPPVE
jgi:hypothetical protein